MSMRHVKTTFMSETGWADVRPTHVARRGDDEPRLPCDTNVQCGCYTDVFVGTRSRSARLQVRSAQLRLHMSRRGDEQSSRRRGTSCATLSVGAPCPTCCSCCCSS